MTPRLLLLLTLLGLLRAGAAPPDEWSQIVAMDAGPQRKPTTAEDAKLLARQHLARQREMLEAYVSRNPSDQHAAEARLKLAAVLAAIGYMDGVQQDIDRATALTIAVEADDSVPAEIRSNAAFQHASLVFQSVRGRERDMRQQVVSTAQSFAKTYPGDRRGPRLLVEAATICDDDPALKRTLLEAARANTKDEALRRRISDDLLRLDLLGKPFELDFKALDGSVFSAVQSRGRVVAVVFWSAESPHSLVWLPGFIQTVRDLGPSRVVVATVAVDGDRDEVIKRLRALRIPDWPTYFDGKGWQSPLVRTRGINAVPTVFLIDRKGVLRSINSRDDYRAAIRSLLEG